MKPYLYLILCMFGLQLHAQDNLTYQQPPAEIMELVDVQMAPRVFMDHQQENMVMLSRNMYKSIEELSQEELRLAGLRIDPKINIGSRVTYFNNIQIKQVKNGNLKEITGLPAKPRLSNFSWSPDQTKMAFTNTNEKGVELWVMDVAKGAASRLTEPNLNSNLGRPFQWNKDGQSLLVKVVSSKRQPLINTKNTVPTGPTISVNDGKKAQNRTYQDLLKNPNDEFNFEQLAMSEIYKVTLLGESKLWMESNMYNGIELSPNGKYVMITTIDKPFSYLVPYRRFPFTQTIYDNNAQKIQEVLKVPLIEDLPQGFMACRMGRRYISWRNDKPATLYYVEALDGGDPAIEIQYRDEVFQLDAPFNGAPQSMLKTQNRFYKIDWSTEHFAIAHDYWWNTRNTRSYIFDPSNAGKEPTVLYDRNYQDRYSDPGEFVTERNEWGKEVVVLQGQNIYLLGDGFTKEGQFPFLDQMNIETKKTARLYTSKIEGKLEELRDYTPKNNRLLVRIESPSEYPNYYFRDVKKGKLTQLTDFENPFKSIESVHKEVITYKRDDGLELSGTLYLPVGYDMAKKEKMPMILWAYPTEYKDKASAGQNTSNPNAFTYPYYGSPIYWVTRGYVVLDDASFPIVGEGNLSLIHI